MRPRLIDPNIWQDDRFAPLSIDAKLLFFGLITIADDYGKVKATRPELTMKLFPWGNYSVDKTGSALKELLTVDLIVEYEDGLFFAPAWFEHQTLRYFSRSKIYDISDDVLDKFEAYRDSADDVRFQSKHKKKERKGKTSRPLCGWTEKSLVKAIDADIQDTKDKRKVEILQRLAGKYDETLTNTQIDTYLEVMELYNDRQCEKCMNKIIKKFGKSIPFPDKVEALLLEMFGTGVSTETQIDISDIRQLLFAGKARRTQELLHSFSESRRAGVMPVVWGFLAKKAGGEDNLPVVINDIYGDMDMKWERIQGICDYITNRKKARDDSN